MDLLGGQIGGEDLRSSLPFLPATPLSLSLTLERLCELTGHPSRALNLASCVAFGTTEKQGHCQVVSRWAQRPQATANYLIVRLLKTTHFSTPILDIVRGQQDDS